MTAIIILLACILALLAGVAWLLLRLLRQEKNREAAPATPERTEEKPRHGSVDEGFENIMQYAVKGKNGLEAGTMRL